MDKGSFSLKYCVQTKMAAFFEIFIYAYFIIRIINFWRGLYEKANGIICTAIFLYLYILRVSVNAFAGILI